MSSFRYARSQIAIHWLAALIIIFLLITGTFILADLPNTASKAGNLRIHIIMGVLVGTLVVTRIVLRRIRPTPPPVAFNKLAHAGHMALNLLVLLLVASGAALALQSGAISALIGNSPFPTDFKVFNLRQVHGLLTRLTMAMIAVHILAALYHQYFLRDGVLNRMGLRK